MFLTMVMYYIFESIWHALLCTELRSRCADGRARCHKLKDLNQQQRSCRVPQTMHPSTNSTGHKKSVFNSVLSYFQKQVDALDGFQTKRMRLASSSEDDSGQHSSESADEEGATSEEEQRHIVPHGICAQVDAMIRQLNDAYESLPDKRTRADLDTAYHDVLRRSSEWLTQSAEKHFPSARFIQHVNTVFPTGCMRVSDDRLQWSCVFCPEFQPVKLEKGDKFHRQNCIKHFRSQTHCDNVTARLGTGTALANGIIHNRETHVYADELPQTIIDDAIVSCARKSLSLTSIPVMLNVIARALLSVRGPDELSVKEIMDIRKVSSKGATMLSRLKAVTKTVNTRAGIRSVCRRGRAAVTNRLLKLSGQTMDMKLQHLKKCKFLCLTADESDTYSFSAPLAAALSGCTPTFEWANLFIGQVDVAADKSGPGLFNSLRELLNRDGCDLLKRLYFSCFDGASAMRSTPLYAGLDAYPAGRSVLAEIKRYDSCEKVGNVHGLAHLLNLAQKKAMKLCDSWINQWQDHIKAVFRWFSKSPSRKSKLKQLHKEMVLLNDVVTWRLIYPKYYCPTRWIGIARCLRSIIAAAPLLETYADSLVTEGFRPVREESEDEEDAHLPAEAAHARQEESESDDDSEDGDCDSRHHAHTFHVWGDKYWDLPVEEPDDDDVSIASEADRLTMDTGRAAVWKDLDASTSKKTRCALISERCGLTLQMLGIDAMMLDALQPYKILVERLQTQVVPIGHQVRVWISLMFKQLNAFLGPAPSYGVNYMAWRKCDNVTDDLAAQIESMGRQYVHKFLSDAKYRLRPYWKLILAAETINPCAPERLSPSAWEGVEDLCARAHMSVEHTREIIMDLKSQHHESEEWCRAEVKICKTNLLKFYHDRLQSDIRQGIDPRHPLANVFATLIFSLQFVSACIETYFSKTR